MKYSTTRLNSLLYECTDHFKNRIPLVLKSNVGEITVYRTEQKNRGSMLRFKIDGKVVSGKNVDEMDIELIESSM